MKLYAITKGCYSDYHICGIATSRQKAEKMEKFYSVPGDEALIEEFEANQYNDEFIGKQLFQFVFDHKTNKITNAWKALDPEDVTGSAKQTVILKSFEKCSWVYVWDFEKEHARKIAIDKYFEYKYKKEMGEIKE